MKPFVIDMVNTDEGMRRLADFIKNCHGKQDWENTAYETSYYIAAFIGQNQKVVLKELNSRL